MDLASAEAIAQIVSAIGVVITLAYLAVQIRQSATISRANIRQQLAQQQIELMTLVASEPILQRANQKLLDAEVMTAEEDQAFLPYAIALLRFFESCHAQWEYGTLPDEDWQSMLLRYEQVLALEPVSRQFLRAPRYFNPRFAHLVEAILAGRRPLA